MAELGPFPPSALKEIAALEGNQKCADCPSLDTDWGSVNHGTLICLDCAGKHRSLGVHVSFVRSIYMDTWTPQQVELMRQGGNGQIRDFFRRLKIENSPITTLYSTRGASHYRDCLKERVDKIMKGEIVPGARASGKIASSSSASSSSASASASSSSSSSVTSASGSHESSGHKSTPGKSAGTHASSSSGTAAPSSAPGHSFDVHKATFGEGAMGFTLTKDVKNDSAIVSRMVPGGPANVKGVKVGDVLIAVAGKAMSDYDDIMHMIPLMPRPLVLSFSRLIPAPASAPAPAASSSSASATPVKSPIAAAPSSSAAKTPSSSSSSSSSTPATTPLSLSGLKLSTSRESLNGASSSSSSSSSNSGKDGGHSPSVGTRRGSSKKDEGPEEAVLPGEAVSPRPMRKVKKKHSTAEKHADSGISSSSINSATISPARNSSSSLSDAESRPSMDEYDQQPSAAPSAVGAGDVTSGDGGGTAAVAESVTSESVGAEETVSEYSSLPKADPAQAEDNAEQGGEQGPADGGSSEVGAAPVEEEEEENEEDEEEEEEEEEEDSEDDDDGESGEDEEDGEQDGDGVADDHHEEEAELAEEDAGAPREEAESLEVSLQANTVVKVLRGGKWRSGLIRREHRDGTYKVAYRDGTNEEHVPLDRLAVPRHVIESATRNGNKSAGGDGGGDNSEDNGASSSHQLNMSSPVTGQQRFGAPVGAHAAAAARAHEAYASAAQAMYRLREETASTASQGEDDFVVEKSDSLDDWLTSDKAGDEMGSPPRSSGKHKDITAASPHESSPHSHAQDLRDGSDFRAVFVEAPLGLTLTKGANGVASVTKVAPTGQAARLGVVPGDTLVGIETQWVRGYDEVMATLPRTPYPLALIFRRGIRNMIKRTGAQVVRGSHIIASKIMTQIGLQQKEESILRSPAYLRLSGRHATAKREYIAVTEAMAGAGGGKDGQRARTMTTKKSLGAAPSSDLEFDVLLEEGELGARLEERGGLHPVSVIVSVTDRGQAASKGVTIGCSVVGINGEKFLSHAHTVSTLKHAKRPLTIRFRRLEL